LARNIEIKARIDSIAAVLPRAALLASAPPMVIEQDDTFFHCTTGRLKLRAFGPNHGELIFYQRADLAGPKESFYLITPTDSPDTLRAVLAAAQGVLGQVVKHRTLLLAGRTRIHLDRVQELGEFLELEVVLRDGEATGDGVAEARLLMQRLGVESDQLIEGAYLDMLARRRATD
jgi:adenylate cyclase class IV